MNNIYDLLDKYTTNIRPFTTTPFKGSNGKYHYVYCTINTINNKFYLGKHSYRSYNNNYRGSGQYLQQSMLKYGKDKFIKFIVNFFDTAETAYSYEKSLITECMVKSQDCFNRTGGGKGFPSDKTHPVYQQIKEGKNLFIGLTNPVYKQIKEGTNLFISNNPVYKQIEDGKNIFCSDKNPVKEQTEAGKNKLVGVKPWNHFLANDRVKYTWFLADIFYKIYLKNINLKKIVLLGKQAHLHNIDTSKVSRRSIQSLLQKFKSGWVPDNDSTWLDFRESYLLK